MCIYSSSIAAGQAESRKWKSRVYNMQYAVEEERGIAVLLVKRILISIYTYIYI